MGNPENYAQTSEEYNSFRDVARQVGAADGLLQNARYDPEAGLRIVFYNRPVKNERKSKLGYHHVFGEDGKQVWEKAPVYTADESGNQVLVEDGIPMVADCDCEEENVFRGRQAASTLQRIVKERSVPSSGREGPLHVTPGRPIFEDKIFVKIYANEFNTVDTEAIIVNDKDIADTCTVSDLAAAHNLKYPKHWEDYKKRQNKREEGGAFFGTPLRELAREGVFILKPSQVAMFESSSIRTVEQLLALPDSTAQHFMGINTIRQQVRAWRDSQAEKAPMVFADELRSRMEAENKLLRDQLAELTGTVRALQSRPLADPDGVQPAPVGSASRKGPGRKTEADGG
jgi:hypothetical protein